MSAEGPVSGAGEARLEGEIPAAPSACPDGTGEWDEWYRGAGARTFAQVFDESPYDYARRAFLAGWDARDAQERRRAAGELTKLTEEVGLYDGGRER